MSCCSSPVTRRRAIIAHPAEFIPTIFDGYARTKTVNPGVIGMCASCQRNLAFRVQKSEQTGTRFRSNAAGDFGGKRHLISFQKG